MVDKRLQKYSCFMLRNFGIPLVPCPVHRVCGSLPILSYRATPQGCGFHLVILFSSMGLGLICPSRGLVVGGPIFQGNMGQSMVMGAPGFTLAFGGLWGTGLVGWMGLVHHLPKTAGL